MGARPFLVVAVIAVVVPAAALPQGQLPKGAPIRTLSGPGGTVSKQVALGSDGLAIAVFPISSFGTGTASAIVGVEGASAGYTVDASPGEAFACPAP